MFGRGEKKKLGEAFSQSPVVFVTSQRAGTAFEHKGELAKAENGLSSFVGVHRETKRILHKMGPSSDCLKPLETKNGKVSINSSGVANKEPTAL